MMIRAAVMEQAKAPLVVGDVELDEPRRDEVLVRMLATGICRSDLSYMDGKWPSPLPIVLGHEGAGVVEAVGEGVDESRIGEPVVLTFAPPCGRCRFCLEGRANLCLEAAACMDAGTLRDGTTRLHRGDERVHHLALVSSFADHAVVPANAAIPVDRRAGARARVPAWVRRDHRRDVRDPSCKRSPWGIGRRLRVRRCRPGGRARRRPDLGAAGDRRRPVARQARDGARPGRDPRGRSGRGRSGRPDPGDRARRRRPRVRGDRHPRRGRPGLPRRCATAARRC